MRLRCFKPFVADNPHYLPDGTQPFKLHFPCGKCEVCVLRRSNTWSFRLERELEASTSGAFLTLTYNDENLPRTESGLMNLRPDDHKNFMKRLRKYIKSRYHAPQTIKYYMVGEYGSKYGRSHYHYLIFNLPFDLIEPKWDEKKKIFTVSALEKVWGNGHVYVGDITTSSIRYCTNYVQKSIIQDRVPGDDRIKEFSRMSQGLGKSFLTPARIKFYKRKLLPYIVWQDGKKFPMPRYYRDKLYTEEERFKIAMKLQEFDESQEFIDERLYGEMVKRMKQRRAKYNAEKRQTF